MPIDLMSARIVPEARTAERYEAVKRCLFTALDAGAFSVVECLNFEDPFRVFACEALTDVRANVPMTAGIRDHLRVIIDVQNVERHENDKKGEPTVRESPILEREGDTFKTIRGRQHREPNYVIVPKGVHTMTLDRAMRLLARHGKGYRDQLSTRSGSLYASVTELGYEWRGKRVLTALGHPWVVEQLAIEAKAAEEAAALAKPKAKQQAAA